MADDIPPITVEEIAAADTVLVINEDGTWRFTSRSHSNREVAGALLGIGVAITEGA